MSTLEEPLLTFGLEQEEENKDLLGFYWFKGGFSKDDCEQIKEQAQLFPQIKADTFAGEKDPNRNSTVRWIEPTADTRWMFETLQNFANEANRELFKVSITGFTENIQYTEYEGKGTHYGWHPDIGPQKNKRKISIVVQLSDPADYEGGELIVNTGNEVSTDNQQGSVILFPSFLLHKVSPLISGSRYSLVSWISGPTWR